MALLSVKGHAVGALLCGWIGLVGADADLIERAVVLAVAVILALADSAADALIGIAIHTFLLLFPDVSLIFPRRKGTIAGKI